MPGVAGRQGAWIGLLAGALLLGACAGGQAGAPGAAAHDWLVVPGERIGPITAGTSEAALMRIVGAGQVVSSGPEAGPGRDGVPWSIVYPGTRNALYVAWQSPAREHPQRVEVLRPGTEWHTVRGITIGTPVAELVSLNGGEFRFNGLYAARGRGRLVSWEGGALGADHPLEHFFMALGPARPERRSDYLALAPLVGPGTFPSSHPALDEVPVAVTLFGIRFP